MVGDRPHLPGARLGAGLDRLDAEVARVMARLGAGGAERVEPAVLQPAAVMLDLYGEDIRARAFVTRDDRAEMMLRPDFTVPIVQLHMERGLDAAAYVYCGPVWRRQEAGSIRPREYLQAGIEIFGGTDPAVADAEALARLRAALGDAPVDLVCGDMGLVLAAIDALPTSAARKAALRRHVWRPARFHALLQRFGARHGEITSNRAEVITAVRAGRGGTLVAEAGVAVGLRGFDEILARLERLAEEAATPPLAAETVAGLEAVLAVRGDCLSALAQFTEILRDMPALDPAVDRFAARLTALRAVGIPPQDLRFEAGFGRTTLEYYDGFVFGAEARGRPDLPMVATGGRYDALTAVLGGGRILPAVGGILRPEALLALREGA